jgi:hypothetical protein
MAPKSIYEQLLPGHFRLFRFTIQQKKINGTLTSHNVYESPSYLALSYTWGLAEEPSLMLKPAQPEMQTCSIIIDGTLYDVTPNLHDFLWFFVRHHRYKESYLWIDSICINQSDSVDKSQQVDLMSTIYSGALETMVWLGKADAQTTKVHMMIKRISETYKNSDDADTAVFHHEFRNVNLTDPVLLQKLGLEPSTTLEDWFAITRFFQRRWFNRVWTVQEVGLASRVSMYCGDLHFHWNDVVHCNEVLNSSQLSKLLVSKAKDVYNFTGFTFMFGWRTWITIAVQHPQEDRFRKYPEWYMNSNKDLREIAHWAELIVSMRSYGATDPRDRIYSMVGIWSRVARGSMARAMIPPVDYRKSAKDLFTEFMTTLLNVTGSLNYLSMTQPGTNTTPGLPTWVADFSYVQPESIISYVVRRQKFGQYMNASKNAPSENEGFCIESDTLQMSSIMFGTVTHTGESWEEIITGSLVKTLALLAASPPIYPDGQIRMEAFCSLMLFDTNSEPARPRPKAFWCFFMIALLESIRTKILNGSSLALSLRDLEFLSHLEQDEMKYMPTQKQVENLSGQISSWEERTKDPRKAEGESFKEIWGIAEEVTWAVQRTMFYRRPFLLDTGHIGMTSDSVRPGDSIRILPSTRALFAFRKNDSPNSSNDYHAFVGEAYVSGVMHGEATESVRQRGFSIAWQRISVK